MMAVALLNFMEILHYKNEFFNKKMEYGYEPDDVFNTDIIITPKKKKLTNNIQISKQSKILKNPVSSYFPKYLINSYLNKDESNISPSEKLDVKET